MGLVAHRRRLQLRGNLFFEGLFRFFGLSETKEEGSTVVGNCSATDKGSTTAITGTAAQHEGNDGGSGLCMTSSDHHEIAIFCRILLILADPIDPVSKAVRSSSFT